MCCDSYEMSMMQKFDVSILCNRSLSDSVVQVRTSKSRARKCAKLNTKLRISRSVQLVGMRVTDSIAISSARRSPLAVVPLQVAHKANGSSGTLLK